MAWGMKNYTIQLFGSSIMEGRIGVQKAEERWYEVMRRQLCEMFPATCFAIYNGAVGGQSLRELMAHFAKDLEGHTPDLCLAMFGWNNFDREHPQRIVPFEEQKALMEEFAKTLPEKTRIVGVIQNPLIDRFHFSGRSHAYDEIRAKYGSVNAFHDIERENARRFFRSKSAPFLDLSVVMADEPEKYMLSSDGIHLTPEGHRLFASEICRLLKDILTNEQCV